MVGLKKRSHTQKSHPKVVNPRDIAGERKKKKKKKKKKRSLPISRIIYTELHIITQELEICDNELELFTTLLINFLLLAFETSLRYTSVLLGC